MPEDFGSLWRVKLRRRMSTVLRNVAKLQNEPSTAPESSPFPVASLHPKAGRSPARQGLHVLSSPICLSSVSGIIGFLSACRAVSNHAPSLPAATWRGVVDDVESITRPSGNVTLILSSKADDTCLVACCRSHSLCHSSKRLCTKGGNDAACFASPAATSASEVSHHFGAVQNYFLYIYLSKTLLSFSGPKSLF